MTTNPALVEIDPETAGVLLAASEAVVSAIQLDDSGQMIGQVWMGGNGGLLSHQTLRAVDKLRLTIARVKAAKPPSSIGG